MYEVQFWKITAQSEFQSQEMFGEVVKIVMIFCMEISFPNTLNSLLGAHLKWTLLNFIAINI